MERFLYQCEHEATTSKISDDQLFYCNQRGLSTEDAVAHYQGNGASNGPISNFWQYRYKGILRCNIAIDRIAALETQETETRDRLVAEARFLRGYYYFELVRNFGGVPLMTSFQMPEEVEGTERATDNDNAQRGGSTVRRSRQRRISLLFGQLAVILLCY